jgi:hypothetical protein
MIGSVIDAGEITLNYVSPDARLRCAEYFSGNEARKPVAL